MLFRSRQDVGDARAVPYLAIGIGVMQRDVRIGHGRLLEILVDAAAAALVAGFQFDRHARAVIDFVPLDAVFFNIAASLVVGLDDNSFAFAVENLRPVALGVDLQLVVMRVRSLGDLRHDLHRPAGGQHAVHARSTDADALLAAAHPHAMELRAIKELAENQGNLLTQDAGAAVLHADLEAVFSHTLDMDPDFRQDARLFAGVQGVVDGLFDGREEGFARIVESQQMAVLGKKLAYRDFFLTGGHRLRGRPAAVDVDRAVAAASRLAIGFNQLVLGGRIRFGHVRPVAFAE